MEKDHDTVTNGHGPSSPRTHDHGSDEHINYRSREEALHRVRTAGSVSISPELFEKLYLSPQNKVKGDLRKTFGNPTPIALVGFLVSLFPLSMDLMGWRGAGGSGAASIGAYFFFGGLLMLIGGLFEWVLGNTFPSVVFTTFSGFWFTFGATLNPSFAAWSSYAPPGAISVTEGLQTKGFNASFGFFLLTMGMICLVFMVCSLRTNLVFFIIFLTLIIGFGLLTGAYWALASNYAGNAAFANRLIVGGGATFFVTCLAGWWIFFAIMLAVLDFPFAIPVGDLSHIIKPKSQRMREASEA
ncbi:hypothetical protein F5X68DRAFT_209524 [Plectosphaerella plurivora]|uniref:GPR1/FUN34/YaaH-class plasma membrane protein n=1 Tax=Plectosphaerella plurivora TaxID=936078 RepID=A0A9P8V9T4_9PEZI|nr:hypothetical protein F5X68DRAFT_209524 [Plectosphaerella plurivora]